MPITMHLHGRAPLRVQEEAQKEGASGIPLSSPRPPQGALGLLTEPPHQCHAKSCGFKFYFITLPRRHHPLTRQPLSLLMLPHASQGWRSGALAPLPS